MIVQWLKGVPNPASGLQWEKDLQEFYISGAGNQEIGKVIEAGVQSQEIRKVIEAGVQSRWSYLYLKVVCLTFFCLDFLSYREIDTVQCKNPFIVTEK